MGLLEPVPFYAIGAIVVIEIMDFTFAFLVAESFKVIKSRGAQRLRAEQRCKI